MLWQILVVVFLLWITVKSLNRKSLTKKCKLNLIDFLDLPIIGQALSFYGDYKHQADILLKLSDHMSEKNDWTIGMWLMDWLFLGTANPVIAEYVLKKSLDKGISAKVMQFMMGNGSVFAPVDIWRPRRKFNVPLFALKNLKAFVPIFAAQSHNLVKHMSKEIGQESFCLLRYVTSYTFDSSCATTLGIEIDTQSNPDHPFMKKFESGFQLSAARLFSPWLYSKMIYKMHPDYKKQTENKRVLFEFIKNAMKLNKKKDECNNDREKSNKVVFLDLLRQAKDGQTLSEEEQVEEALVMMLASVDTTGIGVCFTAAMLARHPEVQDTVYRELIDIFGDSDRPVLAEDLPKMQYLEWVIKESLRMYPPVPITERYIDKQCILPSGQIVPPQSSVIISIWGLHHNTHYWGPDVYSFRPERFKEPLKHPFQYIPFSGGQRSCIGYKYAMMSSKTVLATLLRQYKFLPPKETITTTTSSLGVVHPFQLKFDIMMKDGNKFPLRIESRK